MKINVEEIKTHVRISEKGKLKAVVNLELGDLKLKGFRVMESDYKEKDAGLWVVPPSYRDGGGRYHPIVFIDDEKIWTALQTKIRLAYQTQYKEHYKKIYDLKDEDADALL